MAQASESGSPEAVPLGYGKADRKSPLLTKLLIVIACALVLWAGTIAVRWGYAQATGVWRRYDRAAQRSALYGACALHQYPLGTVVFDEAIDPEPMVDAPMQQRPRAPRPIAGSGGRPPMDLVQGNPWWYWAGRPDLSWLSQWNQLTWANNEGWTRDLVCRSGLRPYHCYSQYGPASQEGWADEVFVHELARPDGEKRLVVVGFDAPEFVFGGLTPFRVIVVQRAGWLSALPINASANACGFAFRVPPDQPLRMYAGQIDPADPTHFTIGYETPAGKGVIDGYLGNDDTVQMRVRDGVAR